MIVSASRRTDIPARYADWFMGRIRAGEVYTRNPLNPAQLTRVPLSPEVVDGIVLWTKDPAPLVPYLEELTRRGFVWYLQFTVTPYGSAIERGLREKSAIEATFCEIAARFGAQRLVWRYDPILLCEGIGVDWHKAQFARLCETFSGCTDTVTVSFVDQYGQKPDTRFRAPDAAQQTELAAFIGRTAPAFGIRPVACCEQQSMLAPFGIGQAACIDPLRLAAIGGWPLDAKKDKNQRPGCGCAAAVDIGTYDTCTNGCIYCYATHDKAGQRAARAAAAHDAASPLLCGSIRPGEIPREYPAKSLRTMQLRFLED